MNSIPTSGPVSAAEFCALARIGQRRQSSKPALQFSSRFTDNQIVATRVKNHYALCLTQIHAIQARFPKDIFDVAPVRIRIEENPSSNENDYCQDKRGADS